MKFRNIIPDTINFSAVLADVEAQAKPFVHRASVFADEVAASFAKPGFIAGDPSPWGKIGDDFKFRPKEVTVWFGYKGHTKSGVLSEVVLNFMHMGRRCLVISPEFPVSEILRRKIRQAAATMEPDESYVHGWFRWTDDRLWLFDKQSKLSPELVLGVVAYAIRELGIHHIVVDSLMKCGISPDDYPAQKDFMDRLQHLAHGSEDTHIHMVMHARKGHDDSRPPSIHDVKGASELIDMAENAVSVWMDKSKSKDGGPRDNSKPDVVLTVEAQRNHPALNSSRFALWFAPGLRFVEQANGYAAPYFQEG